MNREEWLAERRLGVGGSDAHHLFNEPPYGCQKRLWLDKRDTPPDYPEVVSQSMRRGRLLEPTAADEYARVTGRELFVQSAAVSHSHPWARVNIDRAIEDPDRGPDDLGVLEIKTVNHYLWRRYNKDETQNPGIPAAHIWQIQHGMFVTGSSWGAFAIFYGGDCALLHWDVERDEALIDQIKDAGDRFWRLVENGPMPDALDEIGRACHSCPWRITCRTEAALAGVDVEDEWVEDPSLAELLSDYKEADRWAYDANATVEAIKEQLRERMGDRRKVKCGESRISVTRVTQRRIDAGALRAAHPAIAEKYTRPSPSERMFIK